MSESECMRNTGTDTLHLQHLFRESDMSIGTSKGEQNMCHLSVWIQISVRLCFLCTSTNALHCRRRR